MEEKDIKDLLHVWWEFYRIYNYSEFVEGKFHEALEKDYRPILKVATYLNRLWQDNYPLAYALYTNQLDLYINAVEIGMPFVFKSEEDMAREEARLLESLRFFTSLNHKIPLCTAYDDDGYELAQ